MTLFCVFAMNCVCGMIVGLRDGEERFWRIVASGACHSKFPWKWWCDIMMPLEEQRAGETRRFESYGRLFGHGEARNRALVGGLDNPQVAEAPRIPRKVGGGGSVVPRQGHGSFCSETNCQPTTTARDLISWSTLDLGPRSDGAPLLHN